jgi:hypothetical protein
MSDRHIVFDTGWQHTKVEDLLTGEISTPLMRLTYKVIFRGVNGAQHGYQIGYSHLEKTIDAFPHLDVERAASYRIRVTLDGSNASVAVYAIFRSRNGVDWTVDEESRVIIEARNQTDLVLVDLAVA